MNGLFSILGKISLNTDTNSIHPHHTFTSSLPHNKIIRWHGQNVEQKVKFSHLNDHISHQNYHNCYFLTSQLRNKGSKKVNFSSFSRCSWILKTCRHVKLALSRANAGRHFWSAHARFAAAYGARAELHRNCTCLPFTGDMAACYRSEARALHAVILSHASYY